MGRRGEQIERNEAVSASKNEPINASSINIGQINDITEFEKVKEQLIGNLQKECDHKKHGKLDVRGTASPDIVICNKCGTRININPERGITQTIDEMRNHIDILKLIDPTLPADFKRKIPLLIDVMINIGERYQNIQNPKKNKNNKNRDGRRRSKVSLSDLGRVNKNDRGNRVRR